LARQFVQLPPIPQAAPPVTRTADNGKHLRVCVDPVLARQL